MTNEIPSSQPAHAHTQGQWRIFGASSENGTSNEIRAGRKLIARVFMNGNPLEREANARLIAAAPQQHDAMLAVLYAPGFDALDDATKNAVRAAVAKVAGAKS